MIDRRVPRACGAAGPLRACGAALLVAWVCGSSTLRAQGAERSATSPETIAARARPSVPAVALFRQHCLSCHDSDGRGAIGRELFRKVPDFTDAAWHASRTDDQLARAVLEGQGKSMPALKSNLSPAEAKRLVAFIRGFRGGRQVVPDEEENADRSETASAIPPARSSPSPAAQPAAARPHPAAALFQRSCRSCHGDDGKGDAVRSLMPEIPDFTNPIWQSRRSRAELAASIREGKGRQMPAFGASLTADEARALADFVLAFGPRRSGSPDAPTSDFDARLRALQREFDSLQRQYRALTNAPTRRQARLQPRPGRAADADKFSP